MFYFVGISVILLHENKKVHYLTFIMIKQTFLISCDNIEFEKSLCKLLLFKDTLKAFDDFKIKQKNI